MSKEAMFLMDGRAPVSADDWSCVEVADDWSCVEVADDWSCVEVR